MSDLKDLAEISLYVPVFIMIVLGFSFLKFRSR
jgi:hypothetical protein